MATIPGSVGVGVVRAGLVVTGIVVVELILVVPSTRLNLRLCRLVLAVSSASCASSSFGEWGRCKNFRVNSPRRISTRLAPTGRMNALLILMVLGLGLVLLLVAEVGIVVVLGVTSAVLAVVVVIVEEAVFVHRGNIICGCFWYSLLLLISVMNI